MQHINIAGVTKKERFVWHDVDFLKLSGNSENIMSVSLYDII